MKQKQKKKKLESPPRNHVVLALSTRSGGSGPHGKTAKAQRQSNRVELSLRVYAQFEEERPLRKLKRFHRDPFPKA